MLFQSTEARDGAVVRGLASHPGFTPGVDAICGLSLLLVLSLAPRGFSPGTPFFPSPQKPTFQNSNSTRNQVDEEPFCGCAHFYLFIIYLFFNSQPTQPTYRSPNPRRRSSSAFFRLVPYLVDSSSVIFRISDGSIVCIFTRRHCW